MRHVEPIGRGDKVRFRDGKLGVYKQLYPVTEDDVFTVEHVEKRHGGKKVLYLRMKDRDSLIMAYPGAVKRA